MSKTYCTKPSPWTQRRAEFLNQVCSSDDALRAESLLSNSNVCQDVAIFQLRVPHSCSSLAAWLDWESKFTGHSPCSCIIIISLSAKTDISWGSMTVISRTDSDGYAYDVWAQEQANSCAVASIWMARNQARQMTINESEWDLAWRMYGQVVQQMKLIPTPPAPMSLDPSKFPADQKTFQNMFASAGTFMNQVTQKLITDGLRVTSTTGWSSPGTAVVDKRKLSDTTPAIVLLGWYGGTTTRSGGHFIVASRVTTSGKVVFLNPWEGQLLELGPGPSFPQGGLFEQIAYLSA